MTSHEEVDLVNVPPAVRVYADEVVAATDGVCREEDHDGEQGQADLRHPEAEPRR